jgi:hypothetical protein
VGLEGPGSERKLADERPLRRDLVGECVVLGRIEPIEPRAEDGHGPPAGGERAAVGGGVDATRETGDDHDTGRGERCGQSAREATPERARRA